MLKPGKYRVYWIASIGAVLVLFTYYGQAYLKIRSVEHHLPLLALSMQPDWGWLGERVIDFELRRRIENGDFVGADVLSDTLAIGLAREELREAAAARVEWLLADLVDINSEGAFGTNPLHQAVMTNDLPAAEELIRLGADPSIRSSVDNSGAGGLDALGYAKLGRAVFPERDWTAMFELLESAAESD